MTDVTSPVVLLFLSPLTESQTRRGTWELLVPLWPELEPSSSDIYISVDVTIKTGVFSSRFRRFNLKDPDMRSSA